MRYIFQLTSILFLCSFMLISCRVDSKVAYRYTIVWSEYLDGEKLSEDTSSTFISIHGRLFEYDLIKRSHTVFGISGEEESRKVSYDTLGLYLFQPTLGRYIRLKYQRPNYVFGDSGRISQKKTGYRFGYGYKSDTVSLRMDALADTVIDGEKLYVYNSLSDSKKSNDSLSARYYFTVRDGLNSLITYASARKFSGMANIYRLEISLGDSTYSLSLNDIRRLSREELRTFKKIIVDVNRHL
jgi:hypothetical protein